MKTIVAILSLLVSLSSFAGSGAGAMAVVLEQTPVERLENDLRRDGFTLSQVVDVFAVRGVYPRCACTSLEMTFTRVRGGKPENRTFGVYAKGLGNSLQVSIQPVK